MEQGSSPRVSNLVDSSGRNAEETGAYLGSFDTSAFVNYIKISNPSLSEVLLGK